MQSRKSSIRRRTSLKVFLHTSTTSRLMTYASKNLSSSGSNIRTRNCKRSALVRKWLLTFANGPRPGDAWRQRFSVARSTLTKQQTSNRLEALCAPTGRQRTGTRMLTRLRKNRLLTVTRRQTFNWQKGAIRLRICFKARLANYPAVVAEIITPKKAITMLLLST